MPSLPEGECNYGTVFYAELAKSLPSEMLVCGRWTTSRRKGSATRLSLRQHHRVGQVASFS